jgi:hypothetical protein
VALPGKATADLIQRPSMKPPLAPPSAVPMSNLSKRICMWSSSHCTHTSVRLRPTGE